MDDNLPDVLNSTEFGDTNLSGAHSPENLFSILENLENGRFTANANTELNSLNTQWKLETDVEESPSCKRLKRSGMTTPEQVAPDGPNRISHIIIERNRRKQMNEHLSVLRSLMPCFYTKKGDQASIIGGVVDFIKELQQVLQSLEAKKQRKTYIEVLSPRTGPLRPRPLPLSPRGSLPISPRTPQPVSPCNPRVHQLFQSPTKVTSHELSSSDKLMEFAADSKSSIADVEVKFSGPNVLVKTMSRRIPGQALKIVTALEGLSLEILQASIGTVDDTMLNSFTIKIGVDCKLSAEELAQQVQQTFF